MPKKKTNPPHIDTEILSFLAGEAMNRLVAPLIDEYCVMIERRIETCKPEVSWDPLLRLHQLHKRALRQPEDMKPIDADTAIMLAGELNIPAPRWALRIFKEVREEKIQDKSVDLNQRLGFTATGKGSTSEAERRAQENLADQSRLRIWGLSLLGYEIKKACWMEAGRLQNMPGWNTTTYFLGYDLRSTRKDKESRENQLYDKRIRAAERLRQDFYSWRTEIEKNPHSPESQFFRSQLQKTQSEFLKQFPKR